MPDVGIVLPVYDQRRDIFRAAIRSISRQTYRNYKMIIVIDGITPGVLRVARQEARRNKRIQIVAYRPNKGTCHALNVGFQLLMKDSRIKYLTWVASDNIYRRAFLRTLRNHLARGSADLGLVYSNMHLVRSKGKFIAETKGFQNQPKEKLLDYNFILGSFMYKTEYARMAGDYQHTPVEDYDYWLRLTDHCSIEYIPKPLVTYRMFAPKSNSVKIRKSLSYYRENRYKFHLVKHLARTRRGIPYQITVVLPVGNDVGHAVTRLEEILEQTYDNFFLLVVDSSDFEQTSQVLRQISDPRIHILSSPPLKEQDLIQMALNIRVTPYLYIHDGNAQIEKKHIESLIAESKSTLLQNGVTHLLKG